MTDYAVTDPSTGETVATYPTITDSELAAAIDSADRAHEEWARQTTTEDRAKLIGRVAALHAERREELAKIIVREMGKPLEQSLGEVDFCAAIYQFYADNGPRFLADQPVDLLDDEGSAVIRQTSLGVLLGIMPWNFPYYQVARFNGGSFVTESADPTEFTRRRLRDLTRLAVRDLGMHYLTIGTGCVRLAALRAHPSEVIPIDVASNVPWPTRGRSGPGTTTSPCWNSHP